MKLRHFSGTLILMVFWVFTGSWGFLIHRTVNQLAIYQLPKGIREFFYQNRKYLVRESVGPDQRRNSDVAEGPRHFIDLEMYGDSAAWKMPLHWNAAVRQYSADTLLKYGYVPYAIELTKEKLTAAFRGGNRDSILFYAADLGHYIGDAHVPLHLTANYDGQLSGQKGIHNLWESQVPELELDQDDLSDRHQAQYLPDPSAAIWASIRETHGLLIRVLEAEKETSRIFSDSAKYQVQIRNGREYNTYSPSFAKTYGSHLGKTVQSQMLRSAAQIADFWYSSWVDAGKPVLGESGITIRTKKERRMEKMEFRAYRQNHLIQKRLLLARNAEENK